jgi:hypothetical protein
MSSALESNRYSNKGSAHEHRMYPKVGTGHGGGIDAGLASRDLEGRSPGRKETQGGVRHCAPDSPLTVATVVRAPKARENKESAERRVMPVFPPGGGERRRSEMDRRRAAPKMGQ